MSSIIVFYVSLLVEAIREVVVLDSDVYNALQEETVLVPVERLEVLVLHHLVATEHKTVK